MLLSQYQSWTSEQVQLNYSVRVHFTPGNVPPLYDVRHTNYNRVFCFFCVIWLKMSCKILVLKWPRGMPISPFIEIHVDCFGNTQDIHLVFRTISALRFCISFELINFISQKQAWSHSLAAGKKISSLVSLCYRPPTKLRQGNVFSCVYPSVCSWGGGGFSSNRTMGHISVQGPALPPSLTWSNLFTCTFTGTPPHEICLLWSMYGWQECSWHTTGMLSCLCKLSWMVNRNERYDSWH